MYSSAGRERTNKGQHARRDHVSPHERRSPHKPMHSCLLLTLPLLALLAVAAANNVPQTHGVHPAHLARYKPQGTGSAQTWTCLDGSKQLPWTSVNDDYCDCPDGSDEPGARPSLHTRTTRDG